MQNKLRAAIANSLIEGILGFGKASMLAGTLSLAGYIMEISELSKVGIGNSLLLILIGFLMTVSGNYFKE